MRWETRLCFTQRTERRGSDTGSSTTGHSRCCSTARRDPYAFTRLPGGGTSRAINIVARKASVAVRGRRAGARGRRRPVAGCAHATGRSLCFGLDGPGMAESGSVPMSSSVSRSRSAAASSAQNAASFVGAHVVVPRHPGAHLTLLCLCQPRLAPAATTRRHGETSPCNKGGDGRRRVARGVRRRRRRRRPSRLHRMSRGSRPRTGRPSREALAAREGDACRGLCAAAAANSPHPRVSWPAHETERSPSPTRQAGAGGPPGSLDDCPHVVIWRLGHEGAQLDILRHLGGGQTVRLPVPLPSGPQQRLGRGPATASILCRCGASIRERGRVARHGISFRLRGVARGGHQATHPWPPAAELPCRAAAPD